MSNEILGYVPAMGRLALIDGQDFLHVFTLFSDLPAGTIVALEILNATRSHSYGIWPVSSINYGDYTIRIDAADHATIPNGSWFRLWTTYPNEGGRFCWLTGPVERNRR